MWYWVFTNIVFCFPGMCPDPWITLTVCGNVYITSLFYTRVWEIAGRVAGPFYFSLCVAALVCVVYSLFPRSRFQSFPMDKSFQPKYLNCSYLCFIIVWMMCPFCKHLTNVETLKKHNFTFLGLYINILSTASVLIL